MAADTRSGRERVHLYDTTLRDGAQTTGVDFSLADKLTVMKMLDRLGIDVIEGGYPGANPLDTQLFSEKRPLRTKLSCFGMTKRAGVSASNDPGVAALLQAEADIVCYVAKAWDFHVRTALGCTLDENLDGVRESIAAARGRGARPSSIASISSTATRRTRITRSPWRGPRMRRAPAGSCSATRTAARCPMPSSRSSVR